MAEAGLCNRHAQFANLLTFLDNGTIRAVVSASRAYSGVERLARASATNAAWWHILALRAGAFQNDAQGISDTAPTLLRLVQ
jgi:hypothetical protein